MISRVCDCGTRIVFDDPTVPDELVFWRWSIAEAVHEVEAHPEKFTARCEVARRIRERLPEVPAPGAKEWDPWCAAFDAMADEVLAAMGMPLTRERGPEHDWYTLEVTGLANGHPFMGRWSNSITDAILHCLSYPSSAGVVVVGAYRDPMARRLKQAERELNEREKAERKQERKAAKTEAAMQDGLLGLLGDW